MGKLRIFTLKCTAKYITAVKLKSGETVKVRFEPVVLFGRVEPSIFSTSNDEVAEKLMKLPTFNSFFFLKEEKETAQPATDTRTEREKLEALLPDKEHAVHVDFVTSVQEANNWLQREHKETFKAKKPLAVKMEAAQKFNTIFDNWV